MAVLQIDAFLDDLTKVLELEPFQPCMSLYGFDRYDFTQKTCNVSCSKKVKLYCMKFIIEIDRRCGNQNTMIPNRFGTGRKEGEEGS